MRLKLVDYRQNQEIENVALHNYIKLSNNYPRCGEVIATSKEISWKVMEIHHQIWKDTLTIYLKEYTLRQ